MNLESLWRLTSTELITKLYRQPQIDVYNMVLSVVWLLEKNKAGQYDRIYNKYSGHCNAFFDGDYYLFSRCLRIPHPPPGRLFVGIASDLVSGRDLMRVQKNKQINLGINLLWSVFPPFSKPFPSRLKGLFWAIPQI